MMDPAREVHYKTLVPCIVPAIRKYRLQPSYNGVFSYHLARKDPVLEAAPVCTQGIYKVC